MLQKLISKRTGFQPEDVLDVEQRRGERLEDERHEHEERSERHEPVLIARRHGPYNEGTAKCEIQALHKETSRLLCACVIQHETALRWRVALRKVDVGLKVRVSIIMEEC